jgi:hypothetical protein
MGRRATKIIDDAARKIQSHEGILAILQIFHTHDIVDILDCDVPGKLSSKHTTVDLQTQRASLAALPLDHILEMPAEGSPKHNRRHCDTST